MSTPVAPAELQELFLFEGLSPAQLDRLASAGERRTYDTGATVYREGDPATELYVLLDGGLRLLRLVEGEAVVVSESEQRGVYGGAVRAYVEPDGPYANSLVATRPSSFFVLPGREFAAFLHDDFPLAVHLLDGLFLGIRNSEATVRQREHLARLGHLSADLAHELNNPASAAVRASSQLRERVGSMRHKLGMIAEGRVSGETIASLVACQEAAVERAAKSRAVYRSPVQEADLEDALVERLEDLDLPAAYDLAAVFAGAGLDVGWLDQVVARVGGGALEGALRWLAYTLETEALIDEVEDAATRISTLVAAVKQYSSMDSATVQDVDVRVGLDSTVIMLGHKLQGVEVVREYDADLPEVPAFPAELNQVWTNLIDNAADAMGGSGRLALRVRVDGEHLLVEVRDDGPGIPEHAQGRLFEAFFTTKPPGQGSGLGLDNARRIVERRHRGTLTFTTGPSGTAFSARLPLVQTLV